MNTFNLKLFFFCFAFTAIIVGCQKESELFEELSIEDKLAAEGMEESFEIAKLYNDSLIWCNDTNQTCTQIFIDYCDSIYHSHDEQYNINHDVYSHNNVDDDHHHSAVSQHHHGAIEHHEEDEGEHHGHNQESHNEMNELREYHLLYHPN
jgi:hypothetical protein